MLRGLRRGRDFDRAVAETVHQPRIVGGGGRGCGLRGSRRRGADPFLARLVLRLRKTHQRETAGSGRAAQRAVDERELGHEDVRELRLRGGRRAGESGSGESEDEGLGIAHRGLLYVG